MNDEQYPARLIISHEATRFVSLDSKSLRDAAELQKRAEALAQWAAAYGTRGYTYTAAAESEAESVAAEIRAELTGEPDYLGQAAALARAKWAEDQAMLTRLEKAEALARSGEVTDLGGGQYQVNGYTIKEGCECMDYYWNSAYNGGWCKHRLAVALGVKARRLQSEAESAATLPASGVAPSTEADNADHTTAAAPRQIELVVTYEADGSSARTRIHNGGKLSEYRADGQAAQPPTRKLSDLYRWLADNGYSPAGFAWLDRGPGNRRRRQTYAREV
jgi:hypothetical protein